MICSFVSFVGRKGKGNSGIAPPPPWTRASQRVALSHYYDSVWAMKHVPEGQVMSCRGYHTASQTPAGTTTVYYSSTNSWVTMSSSLLHVSVLLFVVVSTTCSPTEHHCGNCSYCTLLSYQRLFNVCFFINVVLHSVTWKIVSCILQVNKIKRRK